MTHEEQLIAYAEEIGVPEFTLEQLILSHRRVCAANKDYTVQSVNEWSLAKKRGYEAGLQQVNSEFVSVEKLRTMTVQELSDFLRNT